MEGLVGLAQVHYLCVELSFLFESFKLSETEKSGEYFVHGNFLEFSLCISQSKRGISVPRIPWGRHRR